jgi:hypothetical protein
LTVRASPIEMYGVSQSTFRTEALILVNIHL